MSPLRVVLTGAESTGKTTLARSLSAALQVPFVPEPAREWVDLHGRIPAYRDVGDIAALHADNVRRLLRPDDAVHLLDTDLISTVVYSHYYFGKCPAAVAAQARCDRGDLYLLQIPDFSWQPDPGQRDGPQVRSVVQRLVANELRVLGLDVRVMSGHPEQRLHTAMTHIEALQPGVVRGPK